MIEQYSLSDSKIEVILNNLMQNSFYIMVLLVTICIFICLILIYVGGKIKSEKTIKFGIKNLIFSMVLELIILMIPIIIGFFK